MPNLLVETIEELNDAGHSVDEVNWVGSRDGRYVCSWADFAKIADLNYDDGFGAAEIAEDLVVVGSDFWLERHEYDGAEGWEYKQLPTVSEFQIKPLTTLRRGMWDTVASAHEEEKEKKK